MQHSTFLVSVILLVHALTADKYQEQLDQANALERQQRAYDLMLELTIPYHEAYKILCDDSTPTGYSDYERATYERGPLLAEQPDQEPGFPPAVTAKALELVAQYKQLYKRYKTIIDRERIVTTDYLERLLTDFKQLKEQLLVDADVSRAVTIRIVPMLIRVLKGKDVISYIDEYRANLEKILR